MNKSPELAVIMPVYNEEAAIGNVVDKWSQEFERLGIDYKIHAYYGESKDNTLQVLYKIADENKNLIVHGKSIIGHDPALIRGYKDNMASEWIISDRF